MSSVFTSNMLSTHSYNLKKQQLFGVSIILDSVIGDHCFLYICNYNTITIVLVKTAAHPSRGLSEWVLFQPCLCLILLG